MITAVDTNILLDVLIPGSQHADQSLEALCEAKTQGAIVVCDVVIAEVAPTISSKLDRFLADYGLDYSSTSLKAAKFGGLIFTSYLKRGGKQSRVVADFLVAAHALHHADRLLTRDKGFQRDYFKNLKTWYPKP